MAALRNSPNGDEFPIGCSALSRPSGSGLWRSWLGGGCAILLMNACGGADPPSLDLPPRPTDAPGGAEIAADIASLDLEGRERRLYAEIASGNVPTWLRRLSRVETRGEVGGRDRRVTFWVTPDYLAVGSDADFVLIPLSAPTANLVMELVGGSLPTPKMVDAIWSSADMRLAPIRLSPNEGMRSVRAFQHHDHLVKSQRFIYDTPPGVFVAGHKVDIVLTPAVAANSDRVAIYGWHRPDGRPIQPLYDMAASTLVIFSRGVRLVSRRVLVDGEERDLHEVLRDPELAPLLSEQGVIG